MRGCTCGSVIPTEPPVPSGSGGFCLWVAWGEFSHVGERVGERGASEVLKNRLLARASRVLSSDPSPYTKPQPFSVGVFSCLFATVPACLRGFMRKPADLATPPSGPFSATFRSLQTIFLSDLALRERPKVRKGPIQHPFKSMGYARTNQAVVPWHCQGTGTDPIQSVEREGIAHKPKDSSRPSAVNRCSNSNGS